MSDDEVRPTGPLNSAKQILDRDYFVDMYDGEADPWGFDSRWYERRKYDLTCAALPKERYRRGLEPGCANGALTVRLAARCDELVAFDVIDDAVQRARTRLEDHLHVQVLNRSFPHFWPEGGGDLVVWSEVAYYLTDEGARTALAGLKDWLVVGGDLVTVHYTRPTNYPRTGASISTWLNDVPWLDLRVRHHDEDFELCVFARVPVGAD